MLIPGTNTYVTELEAVDYISLVAGTPLSDPEALLKQATLALDRIYGGRFIGRKMTSTQLLHWPRNPDGRMSSNEEGFYFIDSDGNFRVYTETPTEIKQATIEIAMMLDAFVDVYAQPEPRVENEQTQIDVIKISKTYKQSGGYAVDALHTISLILRPLLNQSSSIRAVR